MSELPLEDLVKIWLHNIPPQSNNTEVYDEWVRIADNSGNEINGRIKWSNSDRQYAFYYAQIKDNKPKILKVVYVPDPSYTYLLEAVRQLFGVRLTQNVKLKQQTILITVTYPKSLSFLEPRVIKK